MKYLLLLLSLLFFACDPVKQSIPGTVISKSYIPAQYKRSEKLFVIFRPTGYDCKISLDVADNTYVNIEVNENTSFMLDRTDLRYIPCQDALIKQYHLDESYFGIATVLDITFSIIILFLIILGIAGLRSINKLNS